MKKGKVQLAYIENDFDMPDRWFGYDAADVVILAAHADVNLYRSIPERGERRTTPQGDGGMGAAAATFLSLLVLRWNMRLRRSVCDKTALTESGKTPLIHCGRRRAPVRNGLNVDRAIRPPTNRPVPRRCTTSKYSG